MSERGEATGAPPDDTAPPRRHVLSDALLRAIVERVADGILVVDEHDSIRFANPAAAAQFMVTPAELVGTPFTFPIAAGESTEIELPRRDGELVTAELRVVEMPWEGHHTRLLSLRDITHRKEAEERIRALAEARAARTEAEASSQAKSEFLAVMSHELRTPLNAILGYAELLALGIPGPLADTQQAQLARIAASGRHLLTLVDDVLDLSRVEAGRLAVDRRSFHAAIVADAAHALVEPQLEARGITFERRGWQRSDAICLGDEDRVRQVLVNLLSNAVKFTEPGGRITVEIAVPEEPGRAEHEAGERRMTFRVHDTGIGIPTDRLETIFAPFTQLQPGRTRRRDGAGLGLAISRRLARLMGGDLTVESALRSGSTFTLWLPAASPDANTAASSAVEWRAPGASRHGLGELPVPLGTLMLRNLERMVAVFVERLRHDTHLPAARRMARGQLADHVAALLAAVASSALSLEESAGQLSSSVTDGSEIQRLVAERHGAQRLRLGFTPAQLRYEAQLLRDIVETELRRAASVEATPVVVEESLRAVMRLLEQAERLSVRSLERVGLANPVLAD